MATLARDQLCEILAHWLQDRLPWRIQRVCLQQGPTSAGFSSETLFATAEYARGADEPTCDLAIRLHSSGPGLFLHSDLRLQWNMIAALAAHTAVPVPPPVGFEPDAAILGAPFSVVRRVPGRVAPQLPNYNTAGWIFDLTPGDRSRLWRHALVALAGVHRVDWHRGFEFLYVPARGVDGLDQLLHWIGEWYQWSRRGRTHALIEEALSQLGSRKPNQPQIGVLWGDAAPNNMIFGNDLSVAAVLDWEAAALGPGEADLAWWLFYDEYLSSGFEIPRLPGLPTREASIEIYESALGRPVRDVEYYELLAHTRNAILSMRSVNRQVERGSIKADTTAITHNPTSRMLAVKMNREPPVVGEDYALYLNAVIEQKRTAVNAPGASRFAPDRSK